MPSQTKAVVQSSVERPPSWTAARTRRRSRSGDGWRRDAAAPHPFSAPPSPERQPGKSGRRRPDAAAFRTALSFMPSAAWRAQALRRGNANERRPGMRSRPHCRAPALAAMSGRMNGSGRRSSTSRWSAAAPPASPPRWPPRSAGFRTVLFAPPASFPAGRTALLLQGSIDLLSELDVWPALAPACRAAPGDPHRRRDAAADPRAGDDLPCLGDRPRRPSASTSRTASWSTRCAATPRRPKGLTIVADAVDTVDARRRPA